MDWNWGRDNEQLNAVRASMRQVFVRSAAFYAVGALGGVGLALFRSANIKYYALQVGTNCFLVAACCFTPREVIAQSKIKVNDTAASIASGAIGGFAAMRVFSGTTRQGVKGAVAFGLCGLVVERANEYFVGWKLRRREELIATQNKAWTPSPWQERQVGLPEPKE